MKGFRCTPLGVKLTRVACGTRHQRDRLAGRASACAECRVGAAHLAGDVPGEWPDGAPVEVVEITAAARREAASTFADAPGTTARARARLRGAPAGEPPKPEPPIQPKSSWPRPRTCAKCGDTFDARGPRHAWCDACGENRARERARKRAAHRRELRAKHPPKGKKPAVSGGRGSAPLASGAALEYSIVRGRVSLGDLPRIVALFATLAVDTDPEIVARLAREVDAIVTPSRRLIAGSDDAEGDS